VDVGDRVREVGRDLACWIFRQVIGTGIKGKVERCSGS
jgi:hypothetical protein